VSRNAPMVPEFLTAIFSQKIGENRLSSRSMGYTLWQVEERQPAHTQPLNEVQPTIQATLIRQKSAAAQETYARALTSEAIKERPGKDRSGPSPEPDYDATVGSARVIAALPDGSQLLTKAFQSKQGDPAQYAATGGGLCDLPGQRALRRPMRPVLATGRVTCWTITGGASMPGC